MQYVSVSSSFFFLKKKLICFFCYKYRFFVFKKIGFELFLTKFLSMKGYKVCVCFFFFIPKDEFFNSGPSFPNP